MACLTAASLMMVCVFTDYQSIVRLILLIPFSRSHFVFPQFDDLIDCVLSAVLQYHYPGLSMYQVSRNGSLVRDHASK